MVSKGTVGFRNQSWSSATPIPPIPLQGAHAAPRRDGGALSMKRIFLGGGAGNGSLSHEWR